MMVIYGFAVIHGTRYWFLLRDGRWIGIGEEATSLLPPEDIA